MAVASGPAVANPTDIVRVFATSGVFTPSFTGTIEILVVAGGGGGGSDMGGGGGAGGVISSKNVSVTSGTPVTVTVGAGGTGAPAGQGGHATTKGTNGGNSVFGSNTAIGGGAAGTSYYTFGNSFGNSGGSGGGGSGYNNGVTPALSTGTGYGASGVGTAGQGNRGGWGNNSYYSGGGGGAGGAGADGNNTPNGGAGILNGILNRNLYWGGGGGGAAYSLATGGNGGIGGGGGGAVGVTTGGTGYNNGFPGGGGSPGSQTNTPGGNGGQNTGGGGGGGSHYNFTNQGGDGGSGIVIVRYNSSLGSSTGGATVTLEDMIFAYDMSNTQSFKGAVATNQFAVPTPDGSNNVTFAIQGTGTFQRVYSGTYGGYTITNNDVVYQYNLTNAGGCYYHGNGVTITAGQSVTFTFDYFISPGAANYPVTNYLANLEGVVGGAATDPTPSITGVWKTATITSTAGSTGACNMYLYPGACNGTSLANSGFILYRNPQALITSTSNFTAPFVGPFGSRSSTQALQDLTGINTVTVNSLTYNSTGTSFSFVRANSPTIATSLPITSLPALSNFSLSVWLNITALPSAGNNNGVIFGATFYSGTAIYWYSNGTTFTIYGYIRGNDAYIATNSYTLPLNTVHQVVLTNDYAAGTLNLYVNGVLFSSVATATQEYNPSLTADAGNIGVNKPQIDGGGSNVYTYFTGIVYSALIYSRALTAAEVSQNFNAFRGRYGI